MTSVDRNLGKQHRSENADISVLEILDPEEPVCKKLTNDKTRTEPVSRDFKGKT